MKTICTFLLTALAATLTLLAAAPPAVPPTLTEDKASVTVNEGMTAVNSGSFVGQVGDTITVTASTGTVTQSATGVWTHQETITLDGFTGDPKLDAAGNLYVNNANGYVTKITPAGVQTKLILGYQPGGILADSEANILYVTGLFGAGQAGYINRYRLDDFTFISRFAGPGSGDGQLIEPYNLAKDAAGNLYVSDKGNSRIQVFTAAGAFVRKWGTAGAGNGQFNFPAGMQITGSTLFIADRNNHRIQYFNTNGTYLGQWGSLGSGNGQFSQPVSVDIDPSGNVFVCDLVNNRVQKFTQAGVFVDKFGPGVGAGALSFPDGIAFVDQGRSIYIVNYLLSNVVKYSTPGTWSWSAAATDGPAGPTTVTITATDSTNATSTDITFPFTVNNLAPTLAIGAPASADEDASVRFTFTATDVSADQSAGFSWSLDYGDGTAVQTVPAGTASPLARTHTFANPGTYSVTATARDKDGGVSTVASHAITIADVIVPGLAGRYTVVLGGAEGKISMLSMRLRGRLLVGSVRLADGHRFRIPTSILPPSNEITLSLSDGSTLALAFDGFGHLSATLTGAGGALTGTGGIAATAPAAAVVGKYTVILEADDDAIGWLTMVVTARGSVRVAGVLPDGSKVMSGQGSTFQRDGGVELFVVGNGTHSRIAGSLQFVDLIESDVNATLEWTSGGTTQACALSGAKFTPGAAPLPAGAYPVALDGAGLSLNGTLTLLGGDIVTVTQPLIRAAVRSGYGIFYVRFSAPLNPIITASGVFQQKMGVGAGNFLKGGEVGTVRIGP